MVRKCCCVMSLASNLGRKIIPPWRAITANLLPGSPSNAGYRSKRPGYLAGSQRGTERISYFPASLKNGLSFTTPRRLSKFLFRKFSKHWLRAIILVFLVMYLFLQNFRATIIPTIAVPVVILGTFAILSAVGFHQHVNYVRDGAGDRVTGG